MQTSCRSPLHRIVVEQIVIAEGQAAQLCIADRRQDQRHIVAKQNRGVGSVGDHVAAGRGNGHQGRSRGKRAIGNAVAESPRGESAGIRREHHIAGIDHRAAAARRSVDNRKAGQLIAVGIAVVREQRRDGDCDCRSVHDVGQNRIIH